MRYLALVAALLVSATAHAEPSGPRPAIGDTFELVLERTSASEGPNGSTGSSFDRWTLVERVIASQDDGQVLEFDMPDSSSAEERQSQWQYPVRILKPASGPLQLLNRDELDKRVDAWLAAAHLPRTACGHWIFTWNAFKIECDPQSAVDAVRQFDLAPNDLRDGAPLEETGALEPAPLRRVVDPSGGISFTAGFKVDPAFVRRSSAESAVVVAEITGKHLTLEDALRAHADDPVSGTISVTFDLDSTDGVWRRTRVTTVEVKMPEGQTETTTTTETLVRRRKP